jgi:DNA-binding IclR family transcriptional regulator
LAKLGPSPLATIVEAIGQDRSNTHRRLQQMVTDLKVRRYTADDGGVIYERVL